MGDHRIISLLEIVPIKGWHPKMNATEYDDIEKHGDEYEHDYLTTLIANRSCDWLEYEQKVHPKV